MNNYHVICFSTEDNNSVSMPTIYFIPKDVKLPHLLTKRFKRCTYEFDEHNCDGAWLNQWLEKNCVQRIDHANFMVVAVNRVVPECNQDMLPTFNM